MSEQSMVKLVAIALKAKLAADDSDVYFRDDGDTCLVDGHVDLKALARAAIEAMRDISDDVADAMNDTPIDGPDYGSFWPSIEDCKSLFAAGIDAALNEKA